MSPRRPAAAEGGIDKLSFTRGQGSTTSQRGNRKGTTVRLKIGAVGVGALSVALVASGCSKTTEDNNAGGDQKANVQAGTVSYEASDNKGPAPAVAGAAKGGNLGVMLPD